MEKDQPGDEDDPLGQEARRGPRPPALCPLRPGYLCGSVCAAPRFPMLLKIRPR